MSVLARLVLLLVLVLLVARAVRRVLAALIEGATPRGTGPDGSGSRHSVHMVRDPVCGTFLPPSNAVVVHDRDGVRYFCSEKCRDEYRART